MMQNSPSYATRKKTAESMNKQGIRLEKSHKLCAVKTVMSPILFLHLHSADLFAC